MDGNGTLFLPFFFTPGFREGRKNRIEEKGGRERRKYDTDLTKVQKESRGGFVRDAARGLLASEYPPYPPRGLVAALPIVCGDVCGIGPFQVDLFVSFALLALRYV